MHGARIDSVSTNKEVDANIGKLDNFRDESKPDKSVGIFGSLPCSKNFPDEPVQEVATLVHPSEAGQFESEDQSGDNFSRTPFADDKSVISVSSHSDSEVVPSEIVTDTDKRSQPPFVEPSKKRSRQEAESHKEKPECSQPCMPDEFIASCQPKECPVVIEIFAGSGRVTAHLKHVGIKAAFGVDHKVLSKIAPIKVCDLTTKEGQKLCMEWCKSPLLAGVFIAPPCGTCSLARSIIIRDSKGRPLPGPVPLRSVSQPNGLPFLSPLNRARVSSANRLYEFVSKLVSKLIPLGIPIVIENPRSSLYWLTTFFQAIKHHFRFTAHQACAYGGRRPKWTALAHTHEIFSRINKCCPGECSSHKHEPWGFTFKNNTRVFATSEEAAYPMELASEIALAFRGALQASNWIIEPSGWTHSSFAAMRAIAGNQPKASKLPPLVTEHKFVIKVQGPHECMQKLPQNTMQRCKNVLALPDRCTASFECIPSESQLLRTANYRSKGGEFLSSQVWGVPWSEDEFVCKAIERGHPRSFSALLPPALDEALSCTVNMSCGELAKLRSKWFSRWVARAKELGPAEDALKENLPPHLRKILAPKRILLFAEILQAEGYPDMGVVQELLEGTRLVGQVPCTGVFDKCFKPASLSVSELLENSPDVNKKIFFGARSSGDETVDLTVYEKTLEERDEGWLRGPISFESLPEGSVLSRRFGLKQPNKIRLIDDLSGSFINMTVQSNETPRPHTTDVAASLALGFLERYSGPVVGKTFDLKSAYRQLGIAEDSLPFSYIVCFNPHTRRPEIFQMLAAPFGASRSVFSFLRISKCIWWIGCKCLKVCWSNFYDDYITLSTSAGASNTEASISLLFDLLGWRFAREGDKAFPFGGHFNALGIRISLEHFESGRVEFSNTENRVLEVCGIIKQVLESGRLESKQAVRLRGRLQFADGQLFGRLGKLCLKEITLHAFGSNNGVLSSRCKFLLKLFCDRLASGRPRVISMSTGSCWYLFTDACYEPEHPSWRCGLGGVLVDMSGQTKQFFSVCLDDDQIAVLGGSTKKTIIFEAELITVIVAIRLWLDIIKHSLVVCYIDNNSARDVAISAGGRSKIALALIDVLLQAEHSGAFFPWYARVPSPSNPSDRPSRNNNEWLVQRGVLRRDVAATLADVISEVSDSKVG